MTDEEKCRILLLQMGEMWADDVIQQHHDAGTVDAMFAKCLLGLAHLMGCEPENLYLDEEAQLYKIRKSH